MSRPSSARLRTNDVAQNYRFNTRAVEQQWKTFGVLRVSAERASKHAFSSYFCLFSNAVSGSRHPAPSRLTRPGTYTAICPSKRVSVLEKHINITLETSSVAPPLPKLPGSHGVQ